MNVSSDRLLRRTLWGNAVFSVVSGAGLAIVFELLGVGVIAFGVACALAARSETLPRAWAQAIFYADIAWVLASALVLALPAAWTTAGIAGIAVLALIVADLAVLEYFGLRRLRSAT
ncbi:MAG: hypothetical protein EXR12_15740 [Rhodospirillaceae bacterium]|nr:hypothetical protein [Rhodospirillaceae bacterium]